MGMRPKERHLPLTANRQPMTSTGTSFDAPWSPGITRPLSSHSRSCVWASPKIDKVFKVAVTVFFGFIAALLTYGIIQTEFSETKSPSRTKTDSDFYADLGAALRPQPPRKANFHEPFRLGQFTYTVTNVERHKTVGRDDGETTASDGASFIVVAFTVVNEGDWTEIRLSADFQIVDAMDRRFDPSREANIALGMSERILSGLRPGVETSLVTAFEVPDTVFDEPFSLVIPERPPFGTETIIIDLYRRQ